MDTRFQVVELMGVNVSVVGVEDLLAFILERALARQVTLIDNVNIHAMNLAEADLEFRRVLNRADVVFCDGYGVKLGARLLGARLGERMTPPDWIDRLFMECVAHSLSVYALGDTVEEVTAFVRAVRARFPLLQVAGCHHGFFDVNGEENEEVVQRIRASNADIVLVGMGMPRQEKWAFQNRDRFAKGVLIATGALYRWYTGSQRRSPRWMTDYGLEWLGRLVRDPTRMWRRYMIGNLAFFRRVLARRLRAPARNASRSDAGR